MPYAVFTTSGTWTVPLTADPSTVAVYAWGEGGNGYQGVRYGSSYLAGDGGGGGAIAGEPALGGLHVGTILSFTIGQGGTGTNTKVTGGSVTITAKCGTSAVLSAAGAGGAAGSNTIARAGGAGGFQSTTGTPGGGGGGSAGSTGPGGGGSGSSGGSAGSGAAGPPSLAGQPGASGTHGAGADGATPGAGGAGGGNANPGGQGAPGQVIITWTTLNGIGLSLAVVGVNAEIPMPLETSLTVTATAGGSTANGVILAVEVLDAAALSTTVNGGTTQSGSGQNAEQSVTPAVTGSLIYSAVSLPGHGSAPTAATGQTTLQSATWGGAAYVSSSTQTANTPFKAGSSTSATGGVAALEVTPFGGSISTDASTPAAVSATGATVAETAAFSPPTGSLILALVSANGGGGAVSMAVTDSFGLTWTAAEAAATAGDGYAAIWYAYAPAAVALSAYSPLPGLVGSAYSYTMAATGGYGNYSWTVASGSLPAGLSLNGTTGIISGTPTTAGLSTFTVTVTDGFGNAVTSGSISLAVNEGWTTGGVTGWTGSAAAYSYGTLEVPVANADHDWLFVSVSWESAEDQGIAYVADNVRNAYQVVSISPQGPVMNQVWAVPNAKTASTVYVSTSAFVRWLSVLVLDVPDLEPGYVVDAAQAYSGAAASFREFAGTTQPDFVLSTAAFQGSPRTVTQSGTGATWTAAPWAGIDGSSSDGITQSAAWCQPNAAVPWLDGEIAQAGPLAWWKLADAAGTTAADSSGNGNTGTATSVTFANASAPSPPDTSASFASASTSHVLSSYNPAFANGITVEAWVNYNSLSQGSNSPRLVANSHTDSDHNGFELFVSNAGTPQFWVGNGTTAGNAAGGTMPATGWTHIAGTYDGSNVRVYVNGTLETTSAFTGNVTAGSGSGIGLGYGTAYAGDYLNGLLAECAVYGTALSSAQIAAHAAAGVTSLSMQYTVSSSANYAGSMIAVYSAAGLPVNSNPAWPVTNLYMASGYVPNMPAVPPTWTDITSRYLGLSGPRGRNFELDEISAADLTLNLDNFDGALSPGGSLGADLITPVLLTKTWQGRVYTVFRGFFTAIPQQYDFQRGMIKAQVSDDFSKLPNILLPGCMVTDALYDQPLDLWPLNEPQGATTATNWSGRSPVNLTLNATQFGGGTTAASQNVVYAFGHAFPVTPLFAGGAELGGSKKKTTASPPPVPQTPTTGFGSSLSGSFPAALNGTQDSVWGNTSSLTTSSYYQGSILTDSGDTTLPTTATGATYRVWAQMYYVPSNTNAVIMALTDQRGSAGSNVSLILSYNGTQVTATQSAGSTSWTPSAYLFDSRWHLWAVTITTGGTVTVYLDGAVLGSFTGSFPAALPSLLQFGGDATASTASTAGIFTGCLYLAGVYDRVVDPERILSWYQAGATGFLDETAGTRIQRVLTWARWSEAQAVDPGFSLQQVFNYLGSGYGSSGLSGSIGNYATAGGSTGVDQGAQADVTIQDIANTDNSLLWLASNGTLACRQYGGTAPTAQPLGDLDYPLNPTVEFDGGLGEWTNLTSCTATTSAGWSFAGGEAGLITVTGTPSSASVAGSEFAIPAGQPVGFSAWVMSPQGCWAEAGINWYGTGSTDLYTSTYGSLYGSTGTGLLSTTSGTLKWCPPMTPVMLKVDAAAAPSGAADAQGLISIMSSPATGTQLYFDRTRLSPTGFACPYGDDNNDLTNPVQDIQYLYNDIAITRNVDQAGYRARNVTSRNKYFPRVYTRTIYSSADDTTAMPNCANRLLAAFAFPATRVQQVVVDPAGQPEAWKFCLETDIGDEVSFTRNPVEGSQVSGTFLVLGIEVALAPDKAQYTYTLAPPGVY